MTSNVNKVTGFLYFERRQASSGRQADLVKPQTPSDRILRIEARPRSVAVFGCGDNIPRRAINREATLLTRRGGGRVPLRPVISAICVELTRQSVLVDGEQN